MTSLHDATENAAALQRIDALAPDTRPLWGELNAERMCAHCTRGLLVANGELQLKRRLIGRLFGRIGKKRFVIGDKPFPQNLPTDPAFLPPDTDGFEGERDRLVGLVTRYGADGARSTDPHPFFGPMTGAEWDRLMWKHLDHHLRQFGV